jgi:hypothetical protein
MESNNEKAVRALETLKDFIVGDEKPTVKPASYEETMGFMPIEGLGVGDKLRYKGGANLKFPKKGEEVYVYNTVNLPTFQPGDESSRIRRNDFSFIVVYSDGDICEFSADSRYFERIAG